MTDRQHDSDEAATGRPVPGEARELPARTPRRRLAIVSVAVASALVLGGGSAAAGIFVTSAVARSIAASHSASGSASAGSAPAGMLDPRSGGRGGYPESRAPEASTGTMQQSSSATPSTADEQVGVVTILTTIGYDDTAQAAGTGMVMTSDGLVLTNNHVIDGSTSIEVTVESTGETYSATVVGTDSQNDVAVLELADATGLSTVSFDDDDGTAVGDSVFSVGNAEGTGDLVTAAGSVIAVDQSITVGNESTGAGESLSGLIEVDSDVVSGDSGGPLFDDDGEVIGIVTAASSGSTDIVGYAIDIDAALTIVDQIESGVETSTVRIGASPFLGVQLSAASAGATGGVPIGGVIAGEPAAAAGLTGGDTITAIDGTVVGSAEALSAAIAAHEVGDRIAVSWTDAGGVAHSATVTLAAGPA